MDADKPYRTQYLDQDNRRQPKTDLFCVRCNKDIDPSQAHLSVHLVEGGPFMLHPEDEHLYTSDNADLGWFYIGSDCARKVGLEWTTKS